MLSSTILINALIVALANCLVIEDGGMPLREVTAARDLLKTVFTGTGENNTTLKIQCIKFVRANTDMGLRESKDFVEQYVFVPNPNTFDREVIARMKARYTNDL